jgi:dienelactone hydrolase
MKIVYASLFALALVACGAPEVQPETIKEAVVVEETIHLEAKVIDYATDNAKMAGYLVNDTEQLGKKPGVLVVHEWWGHNEYARERADKLAELGYVAFAVDMYGDGKKASHPKDAMKFAGEVFGNIEEAKLRFDKALEILKNDPNVDTTRIAAIGYCFGGSVVLSMANAGKDLDAVAAFHAGLQLPIQPSADSMRTKIAVYQGADDPFVSEDDVVKYKASLDKVGATYEYKAYADAVHAFTSKGADSLGQAFELPLAYNAKADSASWADMQQFFEKYLK